MNTHPYSSMNRKEFYAFLLDHLIKYRDTLSFADTLKLLDSLRHVYTDAEEEYMKHQDIIYAITYIIITKYEN